MSQSVTSAAAAGTPPTLAYAHHRSQPNTISAIPIIQSKNDTTKYHAYHGKKKISKCQSTTPTTPIAAAATPDTPAQARHRSQPNAISTTPARQTEDRCHQVPRLPRKKQGWCLKMPRLPRQQTRQPLRPKRATGTSPMPYVPRLSHKVKIDMWGCCCVWANSVIVVYEQVVWWQVDKVWE